MTIRFNRNENILKSMSAWTFALQTADQNTLKFYLHFCFSLSSVDSHSALNPLQLLCVNSNATEHWRSNDVSLNKRISNVWNLWNHHYFAFLEEFWSTYQNRVNNVKRFKVWIFLMQGLLCYSRISEFIILLNNLQTIWFESHCNFYWILFFIKIYVDYFDNVLIFS